MALEPPRSGQVIRYPYLWHHEHGRGHDEGRKIRPNIVLYDEKAHGKTRIYLLPVTTKPPFADQSGLEVPREVKRHLGLDAPRSWVITSELNHFEWPGADVRAKNTNDVTFGFVPKKMVERLREMARQRHHAKSVNRDIVSRQTVAQQHLSQNTALARYASMQYAVEDALKQSQEARQRRVSTAARPSAYGSRTHLEQRDARVTMPSNSDRDRGL